MNSTSRDRGPDSGGAQALIRGLEQRLSVHRAVTRVLAGARGLSDAALSLLAAIAPVGQCSYGALWTPDARGARLRCAGTWTEHDGRLSAFAAASAKVTLAHGEGLPGRVWASGRAAWIEDIARDANFPRADAAALAGLRSAIGFPVVFAGSVSAVLELFAYEPRKEDTDFLQLLEEVGGQVGQFIERQRAEEARRAADARNSAILAAALDAIITMDSRGLVVEFNPAAEAIFGYAREAAIGREMASLILPPSLREAHREGLRRYLASGEARILGRRIELSAQHADGTVFPVELTVTAIASGVAEPLFTGHIRDIRERKQQEEELRRRADALAEQHRQKDAFLAMLAHELRNPLAPIGNAVQLLRMAGSEASVLVNARDVIERQTHVLSRLVDDLLDVSRITRGTIQLHLENVAVADIVARAVETSAPLIESRGHSLRVSTADGLYVRADATRMAQVVSNLLNNAAKYTPDGGAIELDARSGGHDIVISVRDSGPGIEPQLLPRVFDLFVQGERSLHRAQGGLGIGLTVVKSLVEMHGGHVAARNDGGAHFTVSLPRATGAPASSPHTGHPVPQRSAGNGARVLVVDDNRDAAQTLAQLLKLWGYVTGVCYDGDAALGRAQRDRPDIVILDIGLPGVDGYEVARRLRGAGLPTIALIALTGYGQSEDKQRALEAGFDLHLTKPVDTTKLERSLAQLVAKRGPL